MAEHPVPGHGAVRHGVMLVGYKAPTIGLVATVAALVIAAAALGWKARER